MKTIELIPCQRRPTSHLKRLGTAWRPLVGLAFLALVAWRCGIVGGSGGDGSSCPDTGIQGLWSGPVTSDEVARGNPGRVTASIVQNSCTFSGTWTFTFEDSDLNNLFSIEGGSASESEVSLSIFECTGVANGCDTISTCSYEIT